MKSSCTALETPSLKHRIIKAYAVSYTYYTHRIYMSCFPKSRIAQLVHIWKDSHRLIAALTVRAYYGDSAIVHISSWLIHIFTYIALLYVIHECMDSYVHELMLLL